MAVGLPSLPIIGGPAIVGHGPQTTHVSDLAKKYGDWNWRVATAVALAESRGKVGAQHTNSDGSVDRGLWQINSVHSQFDAQRLLTDPAYNAEAAHEVWKSSGWGAWTTYKSGAYLAFMGQDAKVDGSGGTGIVGGAIGAADAAAGVVNAVPDAMGTIAGVVKALADPSTYLRLGKGALGGVFIIAGVGGLIFVVANKAAGSDTAKAAEATALKVVKTVK